MPTRVAGVAFRSSFAGALLDANQSGLPETRLEVAFRTALSWREEEERSMR